MIGVLVRLIEARIFSKVTWVAAATWNRSAVPPWVSRYSSRPRMSEEGAGGSAPVRVHLADDLEGSSDPRYVELAAEGQRQEVSAVFACRRRPIAGAARIAAIGGDARSVPAKARREPVVRQAHGRGDVRGVGVVLGDPAQLGDGERRHRDQARGISPLLRAELRDELVSSPRRARVVPQQRGPHHGAVPVEQHHAVLLPAHRNRGDVSETTRIGDRRVQRDVPVGGVDLRAVRVRGTTLADQLTRDGIADDDLARLRGGVDAGDAELLHGGQAVPRMCSIASWSSCA